MAFLTKLGGRHHCNNTATGVYLPCSMVLDATAMTAMKGVLTQVDNFDM